MALAVVVSTTVSTLIYTTVSTLIYTQDGPARALQADLLGHTLLPLRADLIGKVQPKALFAVRVVVCIGRNHIVKRLFHAVGLQVVKLHRESYGPAVLRLGPAELAAPASDEQQQHAAAMRADSWRCWPEQGSANVVSAGVESAENGGGSCSGAGADEKDDSRSFCISIRQQGESVELARAQVAQLWEAVGGVEATVKFQMCQLLCRYRAAVDELKLHPSAAASLECVRLKDWLTVHWTLTGPCFDLFPGCACVYAHSVQCACAAGASPAHCAR
jgi:hypothetical protein